VLTYLEPVLLNPDVITEALRRALEPDPTAEPLNVQRERLVSEAAQLDRDLSRLIQAIVDGDAPETVKQEIRRHERRKTEIAHTLDALDQRAQHSPPDVAALRPRLLAGLADWTGLATRPVGQTRQLYASCSSGACAFEPVGAGCVRFRGEGTLAPFLGALKIVGHPAGVAPTGSDGMACWPEVNFQGVGLSA
jgi:hypothetical protein